MRPRRQVRARLRGLTAPEIRLNASAKTALQPATRSEPTPGDAELCAEFSRANAAELSQMYESLQRRERLLAASANASRLLLEAPDVMAAVPHVLRQLGEAAAVDRVNLMLAQQLLRHESVATTQLYLHPSRDDLSEALRSLGETLD